MDREARISRHDVPPRRTPAPQDIVRRPQTPAARAADVDRIETAERSRLESTTVPPSTEKPIDDELYAFVKEALADRVAKTERRTNEAPEAARPRSVEGRGVVSSAGDVASRAVATREPTETAAPMEPVEPTEYEIAAPPLLTASPTLSTESLASLTIVSPTSSSADGKVAATERWLEGFLRAYGGSAPASVVKEAATEGKISLRTLERARPQVADAVRKGFASGSVWILRDTTS